MCQTLRVFESINTELYDSDTDHSQIVLVPFTKPTYFRLNCQVRLDSIEDTLTQQQSSIDSLRLRLQSDNII